MIRSAPISARRRPRSSGSTRRSPTYGYPSYVRYGDRSRQLGDGVGPQRDGGLGNRGGPAHRLDRQRRPVRGGCRACRLRPHRPVSHFRRHRRPRPSAARRSTRLKPEAARPHPHVAAYLFEWAAERDVVLPGVERRRALAAGEPGGGEPAFRAKLEKAGAEGHEAMGIGDIGVSLWGECEEQDGMHLGARGFVACRADRSGYGGRGRSGGRRDRRARPDASSASRGAAASILYPRSCSRPDGRLPRVAVRARGCVASAEPTTCSSSAASTLPLGGPRSRERFRSQGQRPHPREAAGGRARSRSRRFPSASSSGGRDRGRRACGSDP